MTNISERSLRRMLDAELRSKGQLPKDGTLSMRTSQHLLTRVKARADEVNLTVTSYIEALILFDLEPQKADFEPASTPEILADAAPVGIFD